MKKLISVALALVMVLSLSVAAFAAGTTTVYCQTADSWTTCYAYWWGSSTSCGAWPGKEMTKNADGLWTYDIPSDLVGQGDGTSNSEYGLIFTNNGGAQTVNLVVPTNNNLKFVFANNEWVALDDDVKVEEKYFVAGLATLCGSEWNPADTNNSMTKGADGVWTKSYPNVAAGEYELKVTDGTWANSWGVGADNYKFTVETAANVTVKFDAATQTVTVEVGGEPVIDPDVNTGGEGGDNTGDNTETASEYYLVGYFNDVDYDGTDYKFVNGKVTVTFTADSYVFVKDNVGASYMTEAYCTETTGTFVVGGGEKMLVAAGEVTFTMTKNDDGSLTLSYAAGSDSGNTEKPGDTGNTEKPGDTGNTEKPGDTGNTGNTEKPGDTGNTEKPGNTGNTNKPADNLPKDNNDSVLTLFAKVPASWTTVNAYTWDKNNAPQNGEWPGSAMTKDGEWYKIVINDKVANVIINNGADQTKDLAIDSGKDLYVIVADDLSATVQYANDNKGTVEPADDKITGTASNFRVVGNADWMGNWDPASDAGRMLEVSPGVYKQNFDNVQPGNYELKITQNGTWDKCWGDNGNNFCFTVVEACKITVTFTLNGEVGEISVKGLGVGDPGTGDISMMGIYVLMGLAVCAAGVMIINKKKFI